MLMIIGTINAIFRVIPTIQYPFILAAICSARCDKTSWSTDSIPELKLSIDFHLRKSDCDHDVAVSRLKAMSFNFNFHFFNVTVLNAFMVL